MSKRAKITRLIEESNANPVVSVVGSEWVITYGFAGNRKTETCDLFDAEELTSLLAEHCWVNEAGKFPIAYKTECLLVPMTIALLGTATMGAWEQIRELDEQLAGVETLAG